MNQQPQQPNQAIAELRQLKTELQDMNRKLDMLTKRGRLGSWISDQVAIGVLTAGAVLWVLVLVLSTVGAILFGR